MIPIIILQTSGGGAHMALSAMRLLGKEKLTDYKLFMDIPGVEAEIFSGSARQLFITGSFFGMPETEGDFPAFIQKLRDKNPQLVCLSFALKKLEGPFDGAVVKDDDSVVALGTAVSAFEHGAITRTEAKHAGTSFSYDEYERSVGQFVNNPKHVALMSKIDPLSAYLKKTGAVSGVEN